MRSSLCAVVLFLFAGASFGPAFGDTEAVGQEAESGEPASGSAGHQPLRFRNLVEAGSYYRLLEQRDEWRPLAAGPLLRQGDQHRQVRVLRRLLMMYDDLPATEDRTSDRLDVEVSLALRRYQARHGLKVDGILGPQTRASLNVPPGARAQQLELNRVRQQLFYQQSGDRYVQVNIPEYRLRLIDSGASVVEMKAIIGRRARSTPVLSSAIHSLVVNPSWNVPRSIAIEDILPRWQADRQYLDRHNYKVVAGWSLPRRLVPPESVGDTPLYKGAEYLRIWQPPGEGNALGRLKFDFRNSHAVYLHDTPHRRLFARDRRALSSGCVRVEKPKLLARFLLGSATQISALESLLEGSETSRIRLPEPVPLHLTYWTAWIDQEGGLQFRPDIYQRDGAPAGPPSKGDRLAFR